MTGAAPYPMSAKEPAGAYLTTGILMSPELERMPNPWSSQSTTAITTTMLMIDLIVDCMGI
jgi:hypothetical protein